MQFLDDDRVSRVRDEDLLRAARHYRRAISALSDSTFESLNQVTAQRLRNHLMQEMAVVTAELERRGVSTRPANVPAGATMRRPLEPVRSELAEAV